MPDTLTEATLDRFIEDVAGLCDEPQCQDALRQWTDEAKQELGDLMRQETSPDGDHYEPLSPITTERKGHSRILFETGELIESVEGGGSGHIESVYADGVLLGTAHQKDGKPVAAWLQDGTQRMPARPFVGVTENMGDRAVALIADDIMAQIDSI